MDIQLHDIKKFEKAFLNVMYSFRHYLRHLVLVGGWVPYLYSKYLWKNLSVFPVSTLDIDIGIEEVKPYWKDNSLFNKFKNLGYELEPIYEKEPYPLVPIYIDKEKKLLMRIEFITSFYVSDDTINRFVGKEIAVHRIDEFEWLLGETIELKIPYKRNIIKLKLPQPYVFLFHKGLTFNMREDDVKKAKDLYYLYYVLRFCPDYEKLINEIKLLENKEGFYIFIKNIKEVFSSEISDGPMKIESISGFDPYISSLRKDAYIRVQKFIKDLRT